MYTPSKRASRLLILYPLAILLAAGAGCTLEQVRSPSGTPGTEPRRTAAATAQDVEPLNEGERAPSATVFTPDGSPVNLESLYGEAPTVLIFYRGGWCPYCREHLKDLRNIEDELEEAGFQILALSPDRPKLVAEAKQKNDYGYRLLSDHLAEAALAYGLAFRVPGQTLKKYRENGLYLRERSGQPHGLLPVPAAYVVDTDGIIRYAHWDPNYEKRIDAQDLLEAARDAVE
ncbi:MAG: peroxiredoxin-like family protein [Planctomycetota bacterium]